MSFVTGNRFSTYGNKQRRGIGSQLVIERLEAFKDLGYKHVFVLDHPHFYPQFGFVPVKTVGIPVPDKVFMAINLNINHSMD
jgi:putative acetyltransferase